MKSVLMIIVLGYNINVLAKSKLDPKLLKSYEAFKKDISCVTKITSGYRSDKDNTRVKGANKSYHLTGEALDLIFPKCLTSLKDLANIASRHFNGVIVYKHHIHVDIRKKAYKAKGTYRVRLSEEE